MMTVHVKIFLCMKDKIISNEFFKIGMVCITALSLTWGISNASNNELESATSNFSVLGTVSFVSNDTISIIEAQGSDDEGEDLYNLNYRIS